jgi:hypothetical protein
MSEAWPLIISGDFDRSVTSEFPVDPIGGHAFPFWCNI